MLSIYTWDRWRPYLLFISNFADLSIHSHNTDILPPSLALNHPKGTTLSEPNSTTQTHCNAFET
jgi:hypothetical protein